MKKLLLFTSLLSVMLCSAQTVKTLYEKSESQQFFDEYSDNNLHEDITVILDEKAMLNVVYNINTDYEYFYYSQLLYVETLEKENTYLDKYLSLESDLVVCIVYDLNKKPLALWVTSQKSMFIYRFKNVNTKIKRNEHYKI